MTTQAKLPAKSTAQPSGLKLLFQRHRQLVKYLGAVIVFATFVAKDGKRDTLKDLVASLETAENTFVLREENQFVESRISELERSFKEFSEESHKSKPDTEWFEEKLNNALHQVQPDLVALAMRINNIERILEVAPNPQDEQDLRSLKKHVDETYDEWDHFYKAQDARPQSILGVNELGTITAKLSLNLSLLEGRVLDHARQRRGVEEGHYKLATWASWCFYGLGFVLGLIARIYGVEGVAESE
jgi:hypothetical protein